MKVNVNAQIASFDKTNPLVTYSNSLTPKVYNLVPDMGTSKGGTTLKITGKGFGANLAAAKVLIDNV